MDGDRNKLMTKENILPFAQNEVSTLDRAKFIAKTIKNKYKNSVSSLDLDGVK